MRLLIRFAIPLSLMVLPLFFSSAQPFDDGPASERIQQLRRIKLIEALDLDEEQSIRLFARENDFRKEQKELMKRRDESIKQLYKLVKDDAADADLLKGIENVRKVDGEFHEKRYDFIMSLTDILSVKQIAKMVVFEQKFAKEIRDILESLRDRRPPPPDRRR